jgi:hypothetical protein
MEKHNLKALKILYSFKPLKGCGLYFFELKDLSVPSDAPKHLRFQWYCYKVGSGLKKLKFVSMEDKKRIFEDETDIDIGHMECTYLGAKYDMVALTNEENEKLLENVVDLI